MVFLNEKKLRQNSRDLVPLLYSICPNNKKMYLNIGPVENSHNYWFWTKQNGKK